MLRVPYLQSTPTSARAVAPALTSIALAAITSNAPLATPPTPTTPASAALGSPLPTAASTPAALSSTAAHPPAAVRCRGCMHERS